METLEAYEQRFRRAGLPLFIEDYSATQDVFTRAVPLLALVFAAEMLGAIQLDWPLAANVAAAIGGLAILLGAFALLNLARGRRPTEIPTRVGKTELGAFVFLPALLPLIFGGQATSALATAAGNLLLLLLVYAVVGYGLLAIVRWASERLFAQLAASLGLMTRALPLLSIFALVLFLTTELWEVAATTPDAFLIALAALFLAVGGAFLVARVPREVRDLEQDAGAGGPPLKRRQRLNVGLVMLVSQALQILVVTVGVGGFFVLFGMLAVGPELREAWMGTPGEVLLTVDVLGERAELTTELLVVSAGIAAFSGLYYTIAVLTDSTYRAEFRDELTDEMRETFMARVDYLALRAGPAEAAR